jgi:hypothetical protein
MTKASAGFPDNIIAGETDKARLWAVNTETQYHEDKESSPRPNRQKDPYQPLVPQDAKVI